jgi:hypothetical protein
LRGLDRRETGQTYLDGWTLDYNLFRKHEGLRNRTPAHEAGISAPYDEWEDVVEHAAPYKRAQVEVVLVGDKRNNTQMDVSVKDDALDDLPPVQRTRAKPKRQRKANAQAFKSHAPKAQSQVASSAHPYLHRSEYRRAR